jgi:hypothetical protein
MEATVLYGARDVRFEDRPEPTWSTTGCFRRARSLESASFHGDRWNQKCGLMASKGHESGLGQNGAAGSGEVEIGSALRVAEPRLPLRPSTERGQPARELR